MRRIDLDKHPLGDLALDLVEQMHEPMQNTERWALAIKYLELAARPHGVKESTPPSEGDGGDSTSPEAPTQDWGV